MKKIVYLCDRPVIIETTVYEKTLGLVANIINKKINIRFAQTQIFKTMYHSKGFYILLPEKTNFYRDEKEYYRAFEHELSHILFGTSKDIFDKVYSNLPEIPRKVIDAVVNIVEDYRVDSHWNAIYPGSKKIREEFLKSLPERRHIIPDNPLNILQLVRMGRMDIIQNTCDPKIITLAMRFEEILKKVELAGPEATVIASIMILNLISKYLNMEKSESRPTQTKIPDFMPPRRLKEEYGSSRHKIRIPTIEELEKRKLQEIIDETRESHSVFYENELHTIHDVHSEIKYRDKEMKINYLGSIDEILKKCREEGIKINKEIMTKLKEYELRIEKRRRSTKYVVITDFRIPSNPKATINPDKSLVNKIVRELSKIKKMTKESQSEEGYEVDIDSYIQFLIDKSNNEIFIDEIETKGINIAILLDMSGSMDPQKTEIAIKSVLTLWEALEKIGNISFDVFIYSAPPKPDHIYIKRVTKDELKRIVYGYGYTPTHFALDYVSKNIQNRVGKKIIILITDGIPEIHDSNYGSISDLRRDVASKTATTIEQIRKKGIEIFTFFVSPEFNDKTLKEIFGPENLWIKIHDIRMLPKKLYSFVVNKILKSLQTS